MQVDVAQRRLFGTFVIKSEVAKFDVAFNFGYRFGLVAVANGRLDAHDFVHTFHRSHAALEDVDDPAEGNHRPDQIAEVEIELKELPDGDAVLNDQPAA